MLFMTGGLRDMSVLLEDSIRYRFERKLRIQESLWFIFTPNKSSLCTKESDPELTGL